MYTKLTEFENNNGDILRGIFVLPKSPQKIVIMCGGFERTATTEKKFKVLADKLAKQNIASFRFDYRGVGLSDGDFSQTTVKSMSEELAKAIETIENETKLQNVSVVAHSLSACAVAKLANKKLFEKIISIAPALNQSGLLRYWFTVSSMKKMDIDINWNNFREYLDEGKFLTDCQREDRVTKANYISAKYFLENQDENYCSLLKSTENILHIHGDTDDKVPLESITCSFPNQIIVKNGDHDLERPDMLEQWIDKAVKFLILGGNYDKENSGNSRQQIVFQR